MPNNDETDKKISILLLKTYGQVLFKLKNDNKKRSHFIAALNFLGIPKVFENISTDDSDDDSEELQC